MSPVHTLPGGPPRRTVSRRAYLALAGASLSALAGCGGSGGNDGASTPATAGTPTPTDTPPPAATPTATSVSEETATATPTPDNSGAVRRMEAELSTVDFDGEYFDTHAHWLPSMGPDIPSEYATVMDEYDIGAAVLFSPSKRAAREYPAFLETLTDPDVEYLPFMSAPPPGRRLARELRELYGSAGPAFWGVGEWKPQSTVHDFDGERLSKLWTLAAELGVPVMYHPFPEQEGTVEPALAANPDTTFLLHGHQMMNYGRDRRGLGPTLPRLLSEYDNLYWTADVTTLLSGAFLRFRSASAFVDWYDNRADPHIENARQVVSRLLEAAPEKVMWGTDVAKPWNTTDEAFSRLMDATERILEGVPEKHHAAYKRENALAMFGL